MLKLTCTAWEEPFTTARSCGFFSRLLSTWVVHYRTGKSKLSWTRKHTSVADATGGLQMKNNKTGKKNNKAFESIKFESIKWTLTGLSGLLTTSLIIILES
jgi:hypothetical protein